jgi:hypothetical protein
MPVGHSDLRNKVLLALKLLVRQAEALLVKALRGGARYHAIVSTKMRCSIATPNDVQKQQNDDENWGLLPEVQWMFDDCVPNRQVVQLYTESSALRSRLFR